MKFVHNFKPEQELKNFDLRIPGMGFGFRPVVIKKGGDVVFEKSVVSLNNKLKFRIPAGILQIGEIYTLEIGQN